MHVFSTKTGERISADARRGGPVVLGPAASRRGRRGLAVEQWPPMPRFLAAQPDARLLPLPWAPAARRSGRPSTSSRCRAASPGTSCASSRWATRSTPPRRCSRRRRCTSTACCRTSIGTTPPPSNRSPSSPDASTPTATRSTRSCSPGTCEFSLPYRSLFSTGVRHETVSRLLDAMVVLLARLHLIGFLWGDVSLSNILFRRDAGEFAAYLVDAETAELHDQALRRPARPRPRHRHHQPVRRVLRPGGRAPARHQPRPADAGRADREPLPGAVARADRRRGVPRQRARPHRGPRPAAQRRWASTSPSSTSTRRPTATASRIQPKVVDAGHHSRRLLRLTGLDVEENQARRLLNDLDTYRARTNQQHVEESMSSPTSGSPGSSSRWSARSRRPHRQARAGADLPRGARLPLVPEPARAPRGAPRRGRPGLHPRRARALPDEALPPTRCRPVEKRQLVNPFDPSQGFVDDEDDSPSTRGRPRRTLPAPNCCPTSSTSRRCDARRPVSGRLAAADSMDG